MTKIKAGYVMKNNIQILYYADDVMLFAKSENDLQRFLHKFVNTIAKCDMHIKRENTTTVISKVLIRCTLVIENTPRL